MFKIFNLQLTKQNENLSLILNLITKKIRNESFINFIKDNIFISNKKIEISQNEITIKTRITTFKITANPSFEDFQEITVSKKLNDEKINETRKILFRENFIFMDKNVIINNDSETKKSYESHIYLNNELIYKYTHIKSNIVPENEEEIFILTDKSCLKRTFTTIRGFNFQKTSGYNTPPFNTIDIEKSPTANLFYRSTPEEFIEFMKKFASDIISPKELNTLKLRQK